MSVRGPTEAIEAIRTMKVYLQKIHSDEPIRVKIVFVVTTALSYIARLFCNLIGIDLNEMFPVEKPRPLDERVNALIKVLDEEESEWVSPSIPTSKLSVTQALERAQEVSESLFDEIDQIVREFNFRYHATQLITDPIDPKLKLALRVKFYSEVRKLELFQSVGITTPEALLTIQNCEKSNQWMREQIRTKQQKLSYHDTLVFDEVTPSEAERYRAAADLANALMNSQPHLLAGVARFWTKKIETMGQTGVDVSKFISSCIDLHTVVNSLESVDHPTLQREPHSLFTVPTLRSKVKLLSPSKGSRVKAMFSQILRKKRGGYVHLLRKCMDEFLIHRSHIEIEMSDDYYAVSSYHLLRVCARLVEAALLCQIDQRDAYPRSLVDLFNLSNFDGNDRVFYFLRVLDSIHLGELSILEMYYPYETVVAQCNRTLMVLGMLFKEEAPLDPIYGGEVPTVRPITSANDDLKEATHSDGVKRMIDQVEINLAVLDEMLEKSLRIEERAIYAAQLDLMVHMVGETDRMAQLILCDILNEEIPDPKTPTDQLVILTGRYVSDPERRERLSEQMSIGSSKLDDWVIDPREEDGDAIYLRHCALMGEVNKTKMIHYIRKDLRGEIDEVFETARLYLKRG